MAAIFMGTLAGGAIGAGYLTAAHALHARPAAATVAVAQPVAVAPSATPSSTIGAVSLPPPAAPPFRFAAVARAATDLQCLTEAVYFESRGEPKSGQQAVAQVILNRVRHPAFPKTICAVVHQKTDAGCQFSFACAAEPRGRDETAWRRAQTVAHDALHGSVMREVGDATHFENVRMAAFAGLLKVARIGEHVFYRFAGRNGAAGMFHQTPSPSTAPHLMLASAEPVAGKAAPVLAAEPSADVAPAATKPIVAVAAAIPAPRAPAAPMIAAAPVALVPTSTAPVLTSPVAKRAAVSASVAS